jgi:hypothetical protein
MVGVNMGRMSRTPRSAASFLLAGLSAAIAFPVFAQQPLSERLISLRGEVEQLNSELELLREEQRTVLAGLNAQRAELRASADRQQLLARDAEAKRDAVLAEVASRGASGDALSPILLSAIDQLGNQVRGGLPFKVEERLAALDEMRLQINNGSLPPARAANRLWAFYEDELRLTRETGLHNQTVSLGSERVLAEVVKVGSMALYFRTPDGRYGQALRVGSGWQFVLAEGVDAQKQIAALFDAQRKQIKQGLFTLPQLAAAGGGR